MQDPSLVRPASTACLHDLSIRKPSVSQWQILHHCQTLTFLGMQTLEGVGFQPFSVAHSNGLNSNKSTIRETFIPQHPASRQKLSATANLEPVKPPWLHGQCLCAMNLSMTADHHDCHSRYLFLYKQRVQGLSNFTEDDPDPTRTDWSGDILTKHVNQAREDAPGKCCNSR